jgi:hypothetical protein
MNISRFDTYNSLIFYIEATISINTFADYSKFYLTGTYWYLGEKKPYSAKRELPTLDKQEILKIQNIINANNNLAMGFTIKNKKKKLNTISGFL